MDTGDHLWGDGDGFRLLVKFYWSRSDLQCCADFRCTAEALLYNFALNLHRKCSVWYFPKASDHEMHFL